MALNTPGMSRYLIVLVLKVQAPQKMADLS